MVSARKTGAYKYLINTMPYMRKDMLQVSMVMVLLVYLIGAITMN